MTLTDLDADIKKAAKSVAFQWPGVVEEGDVASAIYIRLMESPGSINKIRLMDDLGRYRAIIGIGHQIASRERKDYSYFMGSYRYSVQEVKAMLKSGGLRWEETAPTVQRPTDEEPESYTAGGPKAPVPAEIVDLRKGMALLQQRNLRYADAITLRYLLEEVPEQGREAAALSRALGALTEEMNRAHRTAHYERDDGPGTRKVIKRAHAEVISRQNWGGDALDYTESRLHRMEQGWK